jgi:adenylate cyclase
LTLMRRNGWIIEQTASVEWPVLVLALVAVMLGLRSMILVSRSISDPLHEVVDAMAQVEQGRLDNMLDVYDRSEIGRLQADSTGWSPACANVTGCGTCSVVT